MTWAAIAALVAGPAACSSGKPSRAGRPPSSAGVVETLPTVPSTVGTVAPDATADRATARAINLRPGDLPGWSAAANTTSNSDRAMSAQMAKCAGGGDPALVDVVDETSPNFDQGEAEVSSDVTMVRTKADGQNDLRALQSPKLQSCIQQVAVPYLKTQLPAGATIDQISFTRLAAPPGIPDSFGFRLGVEVTAPGQPPVSVTSDQLGVLVGRAEIELDDTVNGGTPDRPLEQHLISLLYDRARSQSGTA